MRRFRVSWVVWLFGVVLGVTTLFRPDRTTQDLIDSTGRFVASCVFLVGGLILHAIEQHDRG